MKKLYKLLLILFVLLVAAACTEKDTKKNYSIIVNENISTEYYVGEEIDFKSFFILRDENGKVVAIEDSMIDASEVNLSAAGTYKVKINYQGTTKEVEIHISEIQPITYTININENTNKEIFIGEEGYDYKLLFSIKDSNNNVIPVLDSMIDASSVDVSKVGTYTVRIEYQGITKVAHVVVVSKAETETYEIKVNSSLPTTFELGVTSIDFTSYFRIVDSNGQTIEVTDEMMDTSNVVLTKVGKFTVEINYKQVTKSLEFTLVPRTNTNASDLFISEYVEAKNYDKYIEIFNGTGTTIDLSNYTLMLFNNVEQPAQSVLELSGNLKDGEILVVYHPNAASVIKNSGGVAHLVINFNGNDAIALYKNDILIDVVGDLLKPVGVGWDVGGIKEATKDHTLVRKSTVYGPNSTWTESEWLVLNNEDFSNINLHTMDGYKPIVEEEEEPKERFKDLFISEYFEGDVEYKDSKYIEIYNPFKETVELASYSLAVYKNGETQATFVQPLSGMLNAQEVFIVYAPYSAEEIKSKGHLSSEVCYFNGKAAVALLKDDAVIDVIGVIGEIPGGNGWLVDDYSTTANNTIIRKETIDSPTDEWDPNEWYPCYDNYLYGLGFHDQSDQEGIVYDNFHAVFHMIKNLELDNKGTAVGASPITVKGTIFMDVGNETTLVYITDGRNFIKLHGEKIHNYTSPGMVYEIVCNYQAYLYQPTLDVLHPDTDIKKLANEEPVTEVEVLEVTLEEILALKKEDFAYNITNGYLQSLLKITGYLQLDKHNSRRYDYALTVSESYTKNKTGYINHGLYFKNDVEDLEDFLIDYEVVPGHENLEVEIFGIIYDWNPNRSNWRIYVSDELTFANLDIE